MKENNWGKPQTTRSRVALEIASHMVGASDQKYRQAKVLLRSHGADEWPVCLFGSSTIEGIEAVARREATMAIVNPSAMLTLAARGTGPFSTPLPLRAIAVIPTFDQFVFAVNADTGLRAFEDIAASRLPLRIALRGQADHSLNHMLNDIVAAAGFSLADLISWGGAAIQEGIIPYPDGPKFQAFRDGRFNAIFDEGAESWVNEAIDAGMTILPLAETTLRALEALGYRRGMLTRAKYPGLPMDTPTVDFSGWTIFVHAEALDDLARQICEGLLARRGLIPWDGEGELPVGRMCLDAPDTPMDVPLHPAAERFWRERGFLK